MAFYYLALSNIENMHIMQSPPPQALGLIFNFKTSLHQFEIVGNLLGEMV